MSVCKKCSKEVPEGFKFCPECGASISDEIISVSQSNIQTTEFKTGEKERTESMAELNKMGVYFSKKQAQYDEYDECLEKIEKLSNPASKGGLFFAILLIAFGLMGFLVMFIVPAASDPSMAFAGFCMGSAFGLFFAGIGVLIILSHNSTVKRRKKELEEASKRQEELAFELEEYFKGYGYCVVGMEYSNPKITAMIYDVIRQGRANNPKEAIKVLLEDAHRSEMEMMAAKAVTEAQAAKTGSGVAAAFCAASFFLK
ncbi:MAG: zinc ribbon domain-containing protein [Lachnospiraceae bacterium]|nr:zinc ribbon domain-containing protein [Lachnospiraceae bacterium]